MKIGDKRPLPAIEIFCLDDESCSLAESIGFGIEEEGLPHRILMQRISPADAYELTRKSGLGVVIVVSEGSAAVYTRQLKLPKPLFVLDETKEEAAKALGKNAARIIKNKPFLDLTES